MTLSKPSYCIGILILAIAILLGLYLAPYSYNPSALFHMDERVAKESPLPSPFVVLTVPAYDGAMYFRVAEYIPSLFIPETWSTLRSYAPQAYSYQRFLLPLFATVLSLGHDAFLPWTFLLINVLSLFLTGFFVFRSTNKFLPALAFALSPSATLGLHFSTAEPLNLLLLALLLFRFDRRSSLDWIDAFLLSLCVLTREVNIILSGALLLWLLINRRYRDTSLVVPSIIVFILWQAFLFVVFGNVPFFVNGSHATVPFIAPLQIRFGHTGFTKYSLSSIALFLFFVVPSTVFVLAELLRDRQRIRLLPFLLLAYLGVMWAMPLHIWGSITSIGRAITPVYPLAIVVFAYRKGIARFIPHAILLIGYGAGLGIAMIHHPFTVW